MKINTFRYFFRDSFKSIRRNSLMSLASIISVIAALIILGIFLVIAFNIKHITAEVEDKLELKIFLDANYTEEQKYNIESSLKANEYIQSIDFESKEDALNSMAEDLEEYSAILQGFQDDNPLPESFVVKVIDSKYIKEVNNYAESLEGVQYVNYGQSYVDTLLKFNEFTNILSIIILIILSCISLFIIYNTIKLTVFARRREISIMKYVGATNWYIRFPFIIEGSILGILGSILAVLVIRNSYYYLLGAIRGQSILMMGTTFAPPEAILPQLTAYFTIYGFIIGSVGSMFSIRKFLDV